MTREKSLAEAWDRFAGPLEEVPDGLEFQYNSMQLAFYIGAASVYQLALEARKADTQSEAIARMQRIYDEVDFFMQALPHTMNGLGGSVAGNA